MKSEKLKAEIQNHESTHAIVQSESSIEECNFHPGLKNSYI